MRHRSVDMQLPRRNQRTCNFLGKRYEGQKQQYSFKNTCLEHLFRMCLTAFDLVLDCQI